MLAEVNGQTIKDMMEMAMMMWPEEDGSFPHLSGITFSVNTDIPSSVVVNEMEEFVSVDGPYRVYDIKIFNSETGKYEPMELTETYTIASHNYFLLEQGSGMKMLEDAVILQNEGLLDVEALEYYIVENLGGTVGEQYRDMVPNITFTEGEQDMSQYTVSALWIIGAVVVLLLALLLTVILIKKRKCKTEQ